MIRALRADEIDVRIGTVGEKGVTFLLYKNARVDMQILDETFGPLGWQRDHKELKGNMYCGIGVWNEQAHDWTWKWDCGTESYTEKEKGESSDSFKRAGTCWGIGRELYTAPRIFIPADTKPKGKSSYELVNKWQFSDIKVDLIEYEEKDGRRCISRLVLSLKGAVVFDSNNKSKRYSNGSKSAGKQVERSTTESAYIGMQEQKQLHGLISQAQVVDPTFWENVQYTFGINRLSEVTKTDYVEITRLAQAKLDQSQNIA